MIFFKPHFCLLGLSAMLHFISTPCNIIEKGYNDIKTIVTIILYSLQQPFISLHLSYTMLEHRQIQNITKLTLFVFFFLRLNLPLFLDINSPTAKSVDKYQNDIEPSRQPALRPLSLDHNLYTVPRHPQLLSTILCLF